MDHVDDRKRPIRRLIAIAACLLVFPLGSAQAQGKPTLLLPFRTVGVDSTTAEVARTILRSDLEAGGVPVVNTRETDRTLPAGAEACDDVDCARSRLQQSGAAQVLFGSLVRLGEKVIVRVRLLRMDEAAPTYADQLSALNTEDLDVVMRRVAEGIAAGRPNSDRASVESVTKEESKEPRRRAGRSGIGARTGFLFPVGNSFGGAARLTNLRLAHKYETTNYMLETTTLLGLSWGRSNVDWTLLDIYGARILAKGDVAPYVGAGLGLHVTHVSRSTTIDLGTYQVEQSTSQTATAFAVSAGGGLILLRTYSFQIIMDLRYMQVFDNFARVDGNGAHGFLLTFGTSH